MIAYTVSPALQAREERWEARQRLAAQHSRPVLSATLRLPYALRMEYVELLHGPVASLPLACVDFQRTADGPCILAVADSPDMDAYRLKTLALELEDAPLGALLDLDVMDQTGRQLCREERGLSPRPCLVCGEPAKECVVACRHDTDAVRAVVEGCLHPQALSQAQLQERFQYPPPHKTLFSEGLSPLASGIARLACLAAEDEIRAHPKPGLVTPLNSGAHADMDVFLFLRSARALAPFFALCAEAGATWHGPLGPNLLAALRGPGQEAERRMFAATNGVNTHKGLVFGMGIVCCAAGYVGRNARSGLAQTQISADRVLNAVRVMTSDLLLELTTELPERVGASVPTTGERLYRTLGVTGARGQAVSGYAAVLQAGLPALREALALGAEWNTARVRALLALMAETEDTNLLHRGGPEGLRLVREQASKALSVPWQEQGEIVVALERACIERRLSAGGCADLLALTLFLHRLETQGVQT